MAKTVVKPPAKTKTVPYDVVEQLRTPEEIAAYLDAWLTEAPDDAAGIARALGDIARARGCTLRQPEPQEPPSQVTRIDPTPGAQ